MDEYIINVPIGQLNLLPSAYAKMSDGLYKMIRLSSDQVILKYFIYCVSIELGFKSIILSNGNTEEILRELKCNVCHDLYLAYELAHEKSNFQLSIEGINAITKINRFYKNKGLEYFTPDVLSSLLKGLSDFPDINELESVLRSINKFLKDNNFYSSLV